MSDSEAGVTSVGDQKSSPQPHPFVPNMRLVFSPDGTAVYRPVTSATSPTPPTSFQSPASAAEGSVSAGGPAVVPTGPVSGSDSGTGSDQLKKKRGRPRKYGPDGGMALAISETQSGGAGAGAGAGAGSGGFSSPPPAATPPSGGSTGGKARGRPPGSSNKKLHVEVMTGSGVLGLMPHVIFVKDGEDVSSKIMAFSQYGPRGIVILSAIGTISNVTLRQHATLGGTVTYEGHFEIVSLSGSFLLTENGNQRSRAGGLSVLLSGPDGRILGGGVAGLLTAGSSVQIIVASFVNDGLQEAKSSISHVEPLSAPSRFAPGDGPTGVSSPPSRGPGSPLNQSTATNNNNPQGMSSMPWK